MIKFENFKYLYPSRGCEVLYCVQFRGSKRDKFSVEVVYIRNELQLYEFGSKKFVIMTAGSRDVVLDTDVPSCHTFG